MARWWRRLLGRGSAEAPAREVSQEPAPATEASVDEEGRVEITFGVAEREEQPPAGAGVADSPAGEDLGGSIEDSPEGAGVEVAEGRVPRLDADATAARAETSPEEDVGGSIDETIAGVDTGGVEAGGDPWQDPMGPTEDPTGGGVTDPLGEVRERIAGLDQGLDQDSTPGGSPGGPGEVHPKYDRGSASGDDDGEESGPHHVFPAEIITRSKDSLKDDAWNALVEAAEDVDSANAAGDEDGAREAFERFLKAEASPHLGDDDLAQFRKLWGMSIEAVKMPRPDGGDEGVAPPESEDEVDRDSAGGTVTDPPGFVATGATGGGLDPGMNPGQVTDPPEFGGSGGVEGGVRPIDSLVTDPPEPEMSAAGAGAATAADAGAVSDTPGVPDPGEGAPSGGEGGGTGSAQVVEVEMVAPSPIPEVGSVEATLAEVAELDAGTGVPAVGRDAGVAEAEPVEEIEEADDPADDAG